MKHYHCDGRIAAAIPLWVSVQLCAQISVFDSVQVGNNGGSGANSTANRNDVSTLDDGWQTLATSTWGSGNVYSVGSITNASLLEFGAGLTASISLRNLSGISPVGDAAAGGGSVDTGVAMQGGAPRPSTLFNVGSGVQPGFWNENSGSSANRNAVLFCFSQPVTGFGAWFADMESSAAGTLAEILLFDSSTNLISQSLLSNSTRRHNGVTTADGIGNGNTRWVGFVETSPTAVPNVRYALIVVGDSIAGGDGFGEHLSFIGPSVAVPETSTVASVSATGFVVAAALFQQRRKRDGVVQHAPRDEAVRASSPALDA